MVKIERVTNRPDHLVFTVPLEDGKVVYMKTDLSPIYGVVIVDAEKFLELWRAEPSSIHRDQSHGNINTWKKDEKYPNAEGGFSLGYGDPVPLAEIGFWPTVPCISLVNGVTRTIWLLSKGCKSFPVCCAIKEAADLFREVGSSGTELITRK